MLLADMAFVRQVRHDAVEYTAPRTHAITSRDLAYNASETAAFSAAGIPNRPGSNKLPKLGTKVIFAIFPTQKTAEHSRGRFQRFSAAVSRL